MWLEASQCTSLGLRVSIWPIRGCTGRLPISSLTLKCFRVKRLTKGCESNLEVLSRSHQLPTWPFQASSMSTGSLSPHLHNHPASTVTSSDLPNPPALPLGLFPQTPPTIRPLCSPSRGLQQDSTASSLSVASPPRWLPKMLSPVPRAISEPLLLHVF